MNKRLLKRIFPLIALAFLLPWPVAYGFEVQLPPAVQESVSITAAGAEAQPTWTVSGSAIGDVTAGDLFFIDATESPADIGITLYLTNAPDLIHGYRYLILQIGLYRQNAEGGWDKVTEAEGAPDTFLTMNNGQVHFMLTGYADYKVTVDDGSFNCQIAGEGETAPNFYLAIDA